MFRRSPEVQKYIYFFVQKLRREPVKEAWEKIQAIDHNDKNALKERVISRGTEHLLYTLNYVPKYMQIKNKSFLINLIKKVKTIEEFEDVLKEFPITEKREIIENPEKLTSVEIKRIPTFGTHSSGTTGQSIRFPKDMKDWAQSHANMFYILSLYNIDPFAPYIYYWAGDWSLKSRLVYFTKDIILNRLRLTSYNTTEWYFRKQYKAILKFRPHYILGIPSGISTFATYILNENLKLPEELRLVFTTGEMLYTPLRKIIKQAFGVPVVDLYGTAEVGVVSFECSQGHHHILMDTNFVEVLDDGTVLITNFFQKAFALVRYRVGDISKSKVIWDTNCSLAYPTIKGIQGRASDKIVLPNGRVLPYMAPTYIFDKIAHTRSIIKFRYELYEHRLVLKIIVNSKYNSRIENILLFESEKIFGIRPEIKIVENIPPLKGGKERYFVYGNEQNES